MATNNLGGTLRRKIYTTPKVLERVTSRNRPASHIDQPRFPRGRRAPDLESNIRGRLPARNTGLESGIRGRLPGAQQLAPRAPASPLESGIRSRLPGAQQTAPQLPKRHPDPAGAIPRAAGLESGIRSRLPGAQQLAPQAPKGFDWAQEDYPTVSPPPRAGAWQGGQTPDTRAAWQASEGFHPFAHIAADPLTWGGSDAQKELISAPIGEMPFATIQAALGAPSPLAPLAEGFLSAKSMADQISAQQSEAGRSSVGSPFSLGDAEGAQPLPEDSPLRNPLYSTPTELPPEDEEALADDSPQTPEELKTEREKGQAFRGKIKSGFANISSGGLEDYTEEEVWEEVSALVEAGSFTWEEINRLYDEFGIIPISSSMFSGSDVGEFSVLDATGDFKIWDDVNVRDYFIDQEIDWKDLLNPRNELEREKGAAIRIKALLNRAGINDKDALHYNDERFEQIDEIVEKGFTSYQEQEWLLKNGMYVNQYGQVVALGGGEDPEDDEMIFNLEPNEKGREFTHEQLAQALELDPAESLMPPAPEPESEKGEYGYEKGSPEDEMMRALFESPLPTHSDRDIEAEKAKVRQANAGVYQDALRTAGYQNLMMGGSPEMAMGAQADMMRRVGTASAQQEMAREFQLRDENFRMQLADAERKFNTLRDIAMMHREDELGSLAFARSVRMAEYMDGLKRDYQTWYHNNFVPPQWMQALGMLGGALGKAGMAYAGGYAGAAGAAAAG